MRCSASTRLALAMWALLALGQLNCRAALTTTTQEPESASTSQLLPPGTTLMAQIEFREGEGDGGIVLPLPFLSDTTTTAEPATQQGTRGGLRPCTSNDDCKDAVNGEDGVCSAVQATDDDAEGSGSGTLAVCIPAKEVVVWIKDGSATAGTCAVECFQKWPTSCKELKQCPFKGCTVAVVARFQAVVKSACDDEATALAAIGKTTSEVVLTSPDFPPTAMELAATGKPTSGVGLASPSFPPTATSKEPLTETTAVMVPGPSVQKQVCACVTKYSLCGETCAKMEQEVDNGDIDCFNAYIGAICSPDTLPGQFDPAVLYSQYCPDECQRDAREGFGPTLAGGTTIVIAYPTIGALTPTQQAEVAEQIRAALLAVSLLFCCSLAVLPVLFGSLTTACGTFAHDSILPHTSPAPRPCPVCHSWADCAPVCAARRLHQHSRLPLSKSTTTTMAK